eukprot:366562-Chlamydomonas_euryale.AAC.6
MSAPLSMFKAFLASSCATAQGPTGSNPLRKGCRVVASYNKVPWSRHGFMEARAWPTIHACFIISKFFIIRLVLQVEQCCCQGGAAAQSRPCLLCAVVASPLSVTRTWTAIHMPIRAAGW